MAEDGCFRQEIWRCGDCFGHVEVEVCRAPIPWMTSIFWRAPLKYFGAVSAVMRSVCHSSIIEGLHLRLCHLSIA